MGAPDGDFDVQKHEIGKRIVISINYCSMYGNNSDIYIQDGESQMEYHLIK
jgi:hypothetical protein